MDVRSVRNVVTEEIRVLVLYVNWLVITLLEFLRSLAQSIQFPLEIFDNPILTWVKQNILNSNACLRVIYCSVKDCKSKHNNVNESGLQNACNLQEKKRRHCLEKQAKIVRQNKEIHFVAWKKTSVLFSSLLINKLLKTLLRDPLQL